HCMCKCRDLRGATNGRMELRCSVPILAKAKRRSVCCAEETVSHVQRVIEAISAFVRRSKYREQRRHLDGTRRMKPAVAAQRKPQSRLEIMQCYSDGSSFVFESQGFQLLVQSIGYICARHRTALYMPIGKSQIRPMPNLATWIRQKDAKSFRTIFEQHPHINVWTP